MACDHFLDPATLQEGETAFYDCSPGTYPGWVTYRNPIRIVSARQVEDVQECLDQAARFAASGGYSAGFVSYEAAPGLDPVLVTNRAQGELLAWFALYDSPPARHRDLLPCYEPVPLVETCPELDFDAYGERFDRVKAALAEGASYQVNLTFRLRLRIEQASHRFFASRCGVDPPRYAAYLNGGDWSVASFSPELFFERQGETIVTRPMKGTALAPSDRGRVRAESERLASDSKSRAENVMIVDMARNDLGSFCETGSIGVRDLLKVERHRNLLQMTSSVQGRSDAPTLEIFRHLFPAASVTGAPKASTMGLIRELEVSPRRVYCGAIGFMGPDHQRFSVGIRTTWFGANGIGEFGVGSGIVWDSDPEAEYRECLAKAERLMTPATQWSLIESMPASALTDPAPHLDRLSRAAAEFQIPFDRARLKEDLLALHPEQMPKVRVALRLDGEWEVTSGPSEIKGPEVRAELARIAIHGADPNLRVKSTSRAVFQDRLNECPDADEMLLYNECGELTEFTRGNVLVEIDGQLWTPHPASGCLEGLGVRRLINEGRAQYRRLTLEDLGPNPKILFVNSVVGILPVRLAGPKA